ncbi:uncharacterized protein LOC117173036 [Belonocnema kinseyi]|uniref:uncharacterized protein LOC117173036 n=1 Tax=Belonocnema kinseyi TaxID=2817044 RepID=UPI00143DAF50|nr:uncharacterized protein LOC117173036 [Belonocnema kinseyi]
MNNRLKSYCDSYKVEAAAIICDVCTRWHYTCKMIHTATRMQKPHELLCSFKESGKLNLCNKDEDERTSVDEILAKALKAAVDKILKHYRKTNWIYCIVLILDPCHKVETFQLTS